MALPKKPRVPIYSSPAKFVDLFHQVHSKSGVAPNTILGEEYYVDYTALNSMIGNLDTKHMAAMDKKNAAKLATSERDTAIELAKDALRTLRDKIWANNPQNPDIVGVFGFDFLVTPATGSETGEESEDPPIPPA